MAQDDRVAVVTGAASGMGVAIAEQLAAGGHRVALLDQNGDAAQREAESLRAHGARTLAAQGQTRQVACAARVYVIEPGQHITCTATDAQGQASEVRIGFEPGQGLRVVE